MKNIIKILFILYLFLLPVAPFITTVFSWINSRSLGIWDISFILIFIITTITLIYNKNFLELFAYKFSFIDIYFVMWITGLTIGMFILFLGNSQLVEWRDYMKIGMVVEFYFVYRIFLIYANEANIKIWLAVIVIAGSIPALIGILESRFVLVRHWVQAIYHYIGSLQGGIWRQDNLLEYSQMTSTFWGSPNDFGWWCFLILSILYIIFFRQEYENKYIYIGLGALVVINILGLITSCSRTAFIALFLLLVYSLIINKNKMTILMTALAGICLAPVFIPYSTHTIIERFELLQHHVNSVEKYYIPSTTATKSATDNWVMSSLYLVFGQGPSSYMNFIHDIYYMFILVQRGLLGVVAYCGLLIYLLFISIQNMKQPNFHGTQYSYLMGFMTIILALASLQAPYFEGLRSVHLLFIMLAIFMHYNRNKQYVK